MTSGSLFERNGVGWSGIPDDVSPDSTSSNGTDSAVFRLNTRRGDFRDVAVSFNLRNDGLVTTDRTPAQAYDGVHVWLRYQDQTNLYAISVDRRDGKVAIKKKVTGGSVNGGTYYDLAKQVSHAVLYGKWIKVRATVHTKSDGTVALALWVDGTRVISALDDGSLGGPPITTAGAVGIRGDNCDFSFANFAVRVCSSPAELETITELDQVHPSWAPPRRSRGCRRGCPAWARRSPATRSPQLPRSPPERSRPGRPARRPPPQRACRRGPRPRAQLGRGPRLPELLRCDAERHAVGADRDRDPAVPARSPPNPARPDGAQPHRRPRLSRRPRTERNPVHDIRGPMVRHGLPGRRPSPPRPERSAVSQGSPNFV